MFQHLFKPLKIGRTTLPNRICFLAHRTNFEKEGRLNDRHLAYYEKRAQGGCGLIILGELTIHPQDFPWETLIGVDHPAFVQDALGLTEAVHRFDTPILARLTHHGFQSSGAVTRHALWGPSPLSDIAFGETAKAMEPEEISEVLAAFSRAAMRIREGGFDGLEIDIGPESLLRQFLSPISNHRQDDYGGSLENRERFPLQVIDHVRKAVGDDYTIGVRLCADEMFWGGITLEESRPFARQLQETGNVDFFNVTVGTYYNLYFQQASMHTPAGFAADFSEQIKKAVDLPVIAAHQIDFPQMAEEILAGQRGDAVGLIRQLICDPDAPKKALEGRPEDIRYCIRDNEGCIGRVSRSRILGCTLNPDVGYERERRPATQTAGKKAEGKKKRVVVIGGGPAGLEAARAAGERGHSVTVYEREPDVGGQINLAAKGAGREGLLEVIRYQRHILDKLGVQVLTGVEAVPEMILEERPDAVIVATGSRPRPTPVPGQYGSPGVLTVWDVLREAHPVGDRVLFIDENGGHHATATVERLADQGKKVQMMTSELFIGLDLGPIHDLYLTRQRLLQKGVIFQCDIRTQEIQGLAVKGRRIYTNEPVVLEGFDTIVVDMGNRVEDQLFRQLKERVKELYRCGDCVAPRTIGMAVFEGMRAGEAL